MSKTRATSCFRCSGPITGLVANRDYMKQLCTDCVRASLEKLFAEDIVEIVRGLDGND